MSLTRFSSRIAIGGLIAAAGPTAGLDGALPGRRPLAGARRRKHGDEHASDTEDTVTLHTGGEEDDEAAPAAEALRRGGYRKSP